MNHIKQITPITIKDIDFTVARQIEQCPKTMMLRELVMNAIEAAATAPEGRRSVEIKGKVVAECGGVRKLTTYEDPELVRELSRQWAERIMMGRVGYAVVYAQAKQLIREWTSDDVRKALEPESLSLAADGWRDVISSAYRSISNRLGMGVGRARQEGADSEELPL